MVEVENHQSVLKQLVETINGSRQKVIRVANTELLTTYWEIGRTILEQKEKGDYSKNIIAKLANDFKAKFPNMRSLSDRNLVYMQTFASVWPFFPFTHEIQTGDKQQSILLKIPWTHHMIILDKTKTLDERIFYINETIRNGWSITMLKINIETCQYKRQ
jgi:predicted nuclease of restriction endonuclease-like (RecB) superfamily